MIKKFIVTTTINPPTKALLKFSKFNGWRLIVVGDLKTPEKTSASFLFTGLGIHMTQTVGLALAADRATPDTRPRVVALLYFMFLFGMGISALIVGGLLADFSKLRLIQVVQGAAVMTLVLNLVAVWRQEFVQKPSAEVMEKEHKDGFLVTWKKFIRNQKMNSLIWVVFLGGF